ncbi:MAG TPA: hypothetical protein VIM65_01025 [Cyclobacteriaceae bacterium]
MKSSKRIFLSCFFVGLASVSGFSQVTNSEINTDSKSIGLRKIAGGSHLHNMNLDINIDNEALETSIELAAERAMESVEVALDKLDVNIEPIEINFDDLDINIDPVIVNIPAIDINIEPIEIEDIEIEPVEIEPIVIDPIVIDVDDVNNDISHFDWYNDNDDDQSFSADQEKDKVKDKNKVKSKEKTKDKDKSYKADKNKEVKEKSKGLKKIN